MIYFNKQSSRIVITLEQTISGEIQSRHIPHRRLCGYGVDIDERLPENSPDSHKFLCATRLSSTTI